MSNKELVVREEPMALADVKHQVNLIQHIMQEVMVKDEHYGIIPGCKKPSLLKPGAEKLNLTFRMAPEYEIERMDFANNHREYIITCNLYSINGHNFLGSGVGSCSSMEGKYRFRDMQRKCPNCGKETIIKGKAEYGGGWLCFAKKGGCGAKFTDTDPIIVDQPLGKAENDNIADIYNTVLKMAKKRAHVDAVLTVTAASDIFTQDIEEMPELAQPGAHAAPSHVVNITPIPASESPQNGDYINQGMQKTVLSRFKAKGISDMGLKGRFGFDGVAKIPLDRVNEVLEWIDGLEDAPKYEPPKTKPGTQKDISF